MLRAMSSAAEYVLAIDLGTSGPKVALVTTEGALVDRASAPTELHLTADGGAEQDPEDWWRAITSAAHELWRRDEGPARASRVVAVCTTAQWAGTVAVDERGAPLCRAIVWMDTRGARYIPELVGGLLRVQGYSAAKLPAWISRTGGIPSLGGKEPVAHIQYLRHRRPEIWRAAHKFLEPKDWVNHRLCGRMCATFDSIALHWVTDNRDIERITYDDKLLAMAQLERAQLPELARATDVLGPLTARAAADLGISPGALVLGGTPDVQSAAVGSGAVDDFAPHLYLGTSSWLTCHVPWKRTDLTRNIASLPSALPGRYFAANSQETAGACVTWLRDRILWPRELDDDPGPPADALARIDRLAASADPLAGAGGAGGASGVGVLFTPWLFGERCPVAAPKVRASFSNLSLRTTRAELCRAVLEGVALNTRWLLGAVERFAGRRLDAIRAVGGGASSAVWCQIHADVLQREIVQVRDPLSCNALGAALLALVGLGKLRVDELAGRVPVAARFAPRPELAERYTAAFAAHRALWKLSAQEHPRWAPA